MEPNPEAGNKFKGGCNMDEDEDTIAPPDFRRGWEMRAVDGRLIAMLLAGTGLI
jgi:hypothetical protein